MKFLPVTVVLLCAFGFALSLVPPPRVCNVPSDRGPCKYEFTRYFFNKATGRCETFIYGGCFGNGNKFRNLRDCEARCMASQVVPPILTCASVLCEEGFICKERPKRGPICVPKSPCDVEKKMGPCEAAIRRYFFNKETGSCQQFFWGGCDANENNFETREECQKTCPSFPTCATAKCSKGYVCVMKKVQCVTTPCNPVPTCVKICELPKQVGPCRGSVRRYFFDKTDQTCKQFFWGGCQPNANNFETLSECEQECAPRPTCEGFKCPSGQECMLKEVQCVREPCFPQPTCVSVCSLQKKVGPCKARIPRWYHNSGNGQCQQFFWGGCRPNGNNFKTKEDCERVCPSVSPCAAILCPVGTVCKPRDVICKKLPCPPRAECVPIKPDNPTCTGGKVLKTMCAESVPCLPVCEDKPTYCIMSCNSMATVCACPPNKRWFSRTLNKCVEEFLCPQQYQVGYRK